MNEREMLELAAKALGLEIIFPNSPFAATREIGSLDEWCHWNPLRDDGDCARMEAELGIWPMFRPTVVVSTFGPNSEHSDIECQEDFADHGYDVDETRR